MTQAMARGSVTAGPLPFVASVVAEVVPDRQIQAWTVISLRISGATDRQRRALRIAGKERRLRGRRRRIERFEEAVDLATSSSSSKKNL
jgi:hypothetical protein